MNLKESIKKNEGFRSHIYKDSLGHPTIGYGFKVSNLTIDEIALNDGKIEPMSQDVADEILELKLDKLKKLVLINLPWLGTKPSYIQDVVIEMTYQMGIKGALSFKNTLNLIKNSEYKKAYENGLKSLWAKQTPNRAKKVLSGLLA